MKTKKKKFVRKKTKSKSTSGKFPSSLNLNEELNPQQQQEVVNTQYSVIQTLHHVLEESKKEWLKNTIKSEKNMEEMIQFVKNSLFAIHYAKKHFNDAMKNFVADNPHIQDENQLKLILNQMERRLNLITTENMSYSKEIITFRRMFREMEDLLIDSLIREEMMVTKLRDHVRRLRKRESKRRKMIDNELFSKVDEYKSIQKFRDDYFDTIRYLYQKSPRGKSKLDPIEAYLEYDDVKEEHLRYIEKSLNFISENTRFNFEISELRKIHNIKNEFDERKKKLEERKKKTTERIRKEKEKQEKALKEAENNNEKEIKEFKKQSAKLDNLKKVIVEQKEIIESNSPEIHSNKQHNWKYVGASSKINFEKAKYLVNLLIDEFLTRNSYDSEEILKDIFHSIKDVIFREESSEKKIIIFRKKIKIMKELLNEIKSKVKLKLSTMNFFLNREVNKFLTEQRKNGKTKNAVEHPYEKVIAEMKVKQKEYVAEIQSLSEEMRIMFSNFESEQKQRKKYQNLQKEQKEKFSKELSFLQTEVQSYKDDIQLLQLEKKEIKIKNQEDVLRLLKYVDKLNEQIRIKNLKSNDEKDELVEKYMNELNMVKKQKKQLEDLIKLKFEEDMLKNDLNVQDMNKFRKMEMEELKKEEEMINKIIGRSDEVGRIEEKFGKIEANVKKNLKEAEELKEVVEVVKVEEKESKKEVIKEIEENKKIDEEIKKIRKKNRQIDISKIKEKQNKNKIKIKRPLTSRDGYDLNKDQNNGSVVDSVLLEQEKRKHLKLLNELKKNLNEFENENKSLLEQKKELNNKLEDCTSSKKDQQIDFNMKKGLFKASKKQYEEEICKLNVDLDKIKIDLENWKKKIVKFCVEQIPVYLTDLSTEVKNGLTFEEISKQKEVNDIIDESFRLKKKEKERQVDLNIKKKKKKLLNLKEEIKSSLKKRRKLKKKIEIKKVENEIKILQKKKSTLSSTQNLKRVQQDNDSLLDNIKKNITKFIEKRKIEEQIRNRNEKLEEKICLVRNFLKEKMEVIKNQEKKGFTIPAREMDEIRELNDLEKRLIQFRPKKHVNITEEIKKIKSFIKFKNVERIRNDNKITSERIRKIKELKKIKKEIKCFNKIFLEEKQDKINELKVIENMKKRKFLELEKIKKKNYEEVETIDNLKICELEKQQSCEMENFNLLMSETNRVGRLKKEKLKELEETEKEIIKQREKLKELEATEKEKNLILVQEHTETTNKEEERTKTKNGDKEEKEREQEKKDVLTELEIEKKLDSQKQNFKSLDNLHTKLSLNQKLNEKRIKEIEKQKKEYIEKKKQMEKVEFELENELRELERMENEIKLENEKNVQKKIRKQKEFEKKIYNFNRKPKKVPKTINVKVKKNRKLKREIDVNLEDDYIKQKQDSKMKLKREIDFDKDQIKPKIEIKINQIEDEYEQYNENIKGGTNVGEDENEVYKTPKKKSIPIEDDDLTYIEDENEEDYVNEEKLMNQYEVSKKIPQQTKKQQNKQQKKNWKSFAQNRKKKRKKLLIDKSILLEGKKMIPKKNEYNQFEKIYHSDEEYEEETTKDQIIKNNPFTVIKYEKEFIGVHPIEKRIRVKDSTIPNLSINVTSPKNENFKVGGTKIGKTLSNDYKIDIEEEEDFDVYKSKSQRLPSPTNYEVFHPPLYNTLPHPRGSVRMELNSPHKGNQLIRIKRLEHGRGGKNIDYQRFPGKKKRMRSYSAVPKQSRNVSIPSVKTQRFSTYKKVDGGQRKIIDKEVENFSLQDEINRLKVYQKERARRNEIVSNMVMLKYGQKDHPILLLQHYKKQMSTPKKSYQVVGKNKRNMSYFTK